MKKELVIDILERIKNLLYNNANFEAKEYINLEIDNLKGITPSKCQNTIYYEYFCNTCSNTNCTNNKHKKS